jgi:hypothetical protein
VARSHSRRTGGAVIRIRSVTAAVSRAAAVAGLLAGCMTLATAAHAASCNDGAVKPDGGGADGYYTCVGGAWIHTVPTFDPSSADGYGPNQPLPPLCIRFPDQYSCPTGT